MQHVYQLLLHDTIRKTRIFCNISSYVHLNLALHVKNKQQYYFNF